MNPRHAAALALVGWYLMVPIMNQYGKIQDAPLAEWAHVDSFDTATECRDAAHQLIALQGKDKPPVAAVLGFQCIESDDPRLKETK